MKKIAFLLSLLLLCTALATPLLAAKKDESSSSSSESSSSEEISSSSDSSSSSSAASSSTADPLDPNTRYALPPDMPVNSRAVYLLNVDSGTVLYENNSQMRMPPASLTKIITCIVALENVANPDIETTELKTYIQNELYNLGGGQPDGIVRGEQLSILDLLHAMMLQSGDSAAMMVADYVSNGSPETFLEMMNEKAREIGALNTHFTNPTGIYDENSYTTAYDMALITQYAMENDDFEDIVTARTHTSIPTDRHPNGITWISNNAMQNPSNTDYYIEGVKGVMSGSISSLKIRNATSIATRNGYTYLLVCLGAPTERSEDGAQYQFNLAWRDSRNLYDWAFNNFTVKTMMNIGDKVAEVPVRLSWDVDRVSLLAAEKFASLVSVETNQDDLVKVPDIPEYINAPVERGTEIGSVKLMLNSIEVGRVPLVAGETIARSSALYYWNEVKNFFSKFIFKFILTFIIILLVLYIALMMLRNHNRKRYRSRKRPQQPGRRR
ncbi:MAG: D-alanyl-D-alanine carboxypeptidase [Anaerotruncus sp.]|nr:D-alanyl-D-alanine carboxypeptidase [Anaerotruncus sp.]